MRFLCSTWYKHKVLFNAHNLGEEHKKAKKITIQNLLNFSVQNHQHRQVDQDIKGLID